jgi:hypothetical protein
MKDWKVLIRKVSSLIIASSYSSLEVWFVELHSLKNSIARPNSIKIVPLKRNAIWKREVDTTYKSFNIAWMGGRVKEAV